MSTPGKSEAWYERARVETSTPNPTSHELARLLLTLPDLPVATIANNSIYAGAEGADRRTHGALSVGILRHYSGDHLAIGNPFELELNRPNWYLARLFRGWLPKEDRRGEPFPDYFGPEDGECNP